MKEVGTTKMINNKDLKDLDVYLFHEGKNYQAYKFLGAHVKVEGGKKGVRFTTWAPKAKNIWVVADFNDFKILDEYKMARVNNEGLWSIFILNVEEGTKYKFAIEGQNGQINYKADPYGFLSELRPKTASIVYKPKRYKWLDRNWMAKRKKFNVYEMPMNIYEMHLGSWKTKGDEYFTYEELSEMLPDYLSEMGYTHVELLPIIEYPLDKSWGYQGIGYYSVTSRYGNMDGFKKLVDSLHRKNIGVILDWVPGHFCKDAHGLYMFDGSPTYEYQEYWKADNKGWGTFNFDLGRPEVRSFLISNAIFWFKEFHIDGLRVDAVSNILYLSYGREDGEWLPNKYGGNGNLEAIDFIKELNRIVFSYYPNALMIAEESTAWPNVTRPIEDGGLGFNFKWNMGWMNDTLEYIELDPIYRKYHHNKMTFSMMYNHSENFILPVSHDEVVHGKKSLISKMFGDWWNQFAGFRVYLSYMMGHPGKKLTFMGTEFAQFIEWREYEQLEWKLIDEFPMHKKSHDFVRDLNKFYKKNRALWELDYRADGFQWIDADNCDQSIFSFMRKGKKEEDTLIFVCNFTPNVYYDFRIGVPYLRNYVEVFNTDKEEYGGSGQIMGNVSLEPEDKSYHGEPYSISIKVPPMATLILGLDKRRER